MTHQEFLVHSKNDSAWFQISSADAWKLCDTEKRIVQGDILGCVYGLVKIIIGLAVVGVAVGLYLSPLKWYFCVPLFFAGYVIIGVIRAGLKKSFNNEAKLKVLASIRCNEELFYDLTASGIVKVSPK